jgi:hypothetical protein
MDVYALTDRHGQILGIYANHRTLTDTARWEPYSVLPDGTVTAWRDTLADRTISRHVVAPAQPQHGADTYAIVQAEPGTINDTDWLITRERPDSLGAMVVGRLRGRYLANPTAGFLATTQPGRP